MIAVYETILFDIWRQPQDYPENSRQDMAEVPALGRLRQEGRVWGLAGFCEILPQNKQTNNYKPES